jgi:DNA-binding IclR family transcriptional regulator
MTRENDTETGAAERNGVQAAEMVLQVLSAFVGAEPALMLKTVAARAGMAPAKAHRYLVSLCRAGFVRQDPESSLYHLADGALRLGLAGMEVIDPLAVSRPILQALRGKTRLSAILAQWDATGPVVALQEIFPAPLTLYTRVGSSLPLLATSTGWTFCAWLPRTTIAPLLAQARKQPLPPETLQLLNDPDRMEEHLLGIRRRGVASSAGQMNSGVDGMSAPVFDGSRHIVGVISVLGAAGQVDLDLEGPTALALKEAAATISSELGWLSAES